MEWLDIVDENGNPTGETTERAYAHRNGIRHRTAHVWLFRRHKGQTEILLQKRSDNKDSYPGCFDISSAGHIPAGVDYIPSAIRELKEELGVAVSEEQLQECGIRRVSADDCFHGIPYHDRQVSKVYMIWYTEEMGSFKLQEEEVSEVCWMEFSKCAEGVRTGAFPNCIDPEELDLLAAALSIF